MRTSWMLWVALVLGASHLGCTDTTGCMACDPTGVPCDQPPPPCYSRTCSGADQPADVCQGGQWQCSDGWMAHPCGASDADTDVPAEAESGTDVAEDGARIPNEWGFDMRYPRAHVMNCPGYWASVESYGDADWICSFTYGGASAVIYARATPVRCADPDLGGAPPIYEASGQVVSDGAVTPLGSVAYDYGTMHNNDFLEFDFGGRHYKAYHSSIGDLWRACQPMDCLQVSDPAGTLIEDGCTCARTIPAICVRILPDGTWAELVDTFAVCPGDRSCG